VLREWRRILVIGSGGAGKSTFARELAALTGLPSIHLDRHFWKPGWVQTPADEWAECVRQLSRGESWIMDGNYGGSLRTRLERCNAVVFFDLPRLLCLRGVLQRRLASCFKGRPDLADGCPDRIDAAFLRWIWRYPEESRPRIVAALESASESVEIVTVTGRPHARRILDAAKRR